MRVSVGDVSVTLERTPDGRRLVVSRPVEAPVEAVWDVLVDTARWPEWGPSITAVDCDQRRIEAGTRGRIRTVGGLWVPFRVTSCTGHRWTWHVAGIPATGHRVDRRGDRSAVAFEVPPLASGYAPVCARACQKLAILAEEAGVESSGAG